MGVSEPGRHLRVVPTDPEALRTFVAEIGTSPRVPAGRRIAAYRLRVELSGVVPAVWRRLVVPSTVTLHELHVAVQVAMGWTDTHLHQWVLPDPSGAVRERFSMRESIEDGFGDGDRCDEDVRLGDVLGAPGDRLIYEYDFGDGWEHSVVLEDIDPAATLDAPSCLAGERACPPEDCGGVPGYERLVDVLGDVGHPEHHELRAWAGYGFDPESFDVAAADAAVAARDALRLHPPVLDSRVAPLLERIPYRAAPHVHSLLERADLQSGEWSEIESMIDGALVHLQWLLRRAGADGIALTSAGYLPPAVIAAARDELDWGTRWVGSGDREVSNPTFRELLESGRAFGLTRKYRGRLLLTKRGATLARQRNQLWEHVLTALPLGRHEVEREAGRLLLLTVAAGASRHERRAAMSEGLAALGWRNADGSRVTEFDAYWDAAETARYLRMIGALGAVEGTPDWARGVARMSLSM
ncbi:plasmid pRiA4b ORF-3 family protein [Rhodococcus sp. NPDC058505]|uniref:plasmid pRiA4b ORF-3 family protein n=1 Tax=Rhodococcus sp. NPDC058505 TaxID=3346531 RepID=UPI00365BD02E